jgi:uncharacterized damage-inducible protein DinB
MRWHGPVRSRVRGRAPGFFPSLAATLNHIYEVDLYYIDALTEGGLGRSVYDREDIDDARSWVRRRPPPTRGCWSSACRSPTPISTAASQTERRDGMTTETIGNLLPHLFQHQVHHRGQAHVQLQHAGVDPPQLDDFFLEYGRVPTAGEYPR